MRFRKAALTAIVLTVTIGTGQWGITSPAAADRHARVDASVVSDDLRLTNVVPTWGAQIPKVVYDGKWYYAATLDGGGTQHPWSAHVWKSRHWERVVTLPDLVHQPKGLLVGRLVS